MKIIDIKLTFFGYGLEVRINKYNSSNWKDTYLYTRGFSHYMNPYIEFELLKLCVTIKLDLDKE